MCPIFDHFRSGGFNDTGQCWFWLRGSIKLVFDDIICLIRVLGPGYWPIGPRARYKHLLFSLSRAFHLFSLGDETFFQKINASSDLCACSADANIAPGGTVSFSFNLQNRPLQQLAQTITVKSQALFSDRILDGSDIMKILPLEFSTASSEQSSHYPCAPNTITVRLRMNIPVSNQCRADDTLIAYNRYPDITISGLTGARNDVITTLTSGAGQFSGVQPVLNAGEGKLTLRQESDTFQQLEYEFTFQITNRAFAQTAPTISVQADILTSSPHTMSRSSSDSNGYTMYM